MGGDMWQLQQIMNSWGCGSKGEWGKGGGKKGSRGWKVVDQNVDATVWIGGIPEGITWSDIQTQFQAVGTVKKVQLLKGGTGLAWFSTPQEAAAAIAMFNGANVNGSILQVDVWTKKS